MLYWRVSLSPSRHRSLPLSSARRPTRHHRASMTRSDVSTRATRIEHRIDATNTLRCKPARSRSPIRAISHRDIRRRRRHDADDLSADHYNAYCLMCSSLSLLCRVCGVCGCGCLHRPPSSDSSRSAAWPWSSTARLCTSSSSSSMCWIRTAYALPPPHPYSLRSLLAALLLLHLLLRERERERERENRAPCACLVLSVAA